MLCKGRLSAASAFLRMSLLSLCRESFSSWEQVGNYALRFDFSDGHRTGLYSFDYLRVLAAPA